jgi:hypothetical protein
MPSAVTIAQTLRMCRIAWQSPSFRIPVRAYWYIIGKYVFADPRAPLFDFQGYKLSWVEVLMVAAAIMAMAEQIKVAKPGINNTTEVLLMGLIAIIQVLLFALGAAKVPALAIFDNTEFLLLTLINLAQTAVAYQINSATLMRTISPVS